MLPKSDRGLVHFQTICYGVIATGICAALIQYLINRSLWLDEASLALNILNRSFSGLFQTLDYYQVAPIGFLMVEKLFTLVFGDSEYALRLFPFLCFLASIPLFYRMTLQLTKQPVIALFATAMFSTTYMLTYFASEVKQYYLDVLALVLIVAVATQEKNSGMRYIFMCTLIGVVAVWFSNVAVIVLFVCGLYLFVEEVLRQRRIVFLIPLALWAVSFLLYYALFVHDHPTSDYMREYWMTSFLPANPFDSEFYSFLFQKTKRVYSVMMGLGPLYMLGLLLSLIGIISMLMQKQYRLIYFSLAPACLHFILSALQLYPFSDRLVLYLVPIGILSYTTGIYVVFNLIHTRVIRLPQILMALPLLGMLFALTQKVPRKREEIKESLMYIESHIHEHDNVYVYSKAQRAMQYYQKTGFTNLDDEVIFGKYHTDFDAGQQAEIHNLSGKVWLLFSHMTTTEDGPGVEDQIINSLIGSDAKLLDKFLTKGSSCYYFDIGDGEKATQ